MGSSAKLVAASIFVGWSKPGSYLARGLSLPIFKGMLGLILCFLFFSLELCRQQNALLELCRQQNALKAQNSLKMSPWFGRLVSDTFDIA